MCARCANKLATALKDKSDFHVVVARSTMLPGSMRNVVIPALESFSGKKAGIDFGVCNNPEFLRKGQRYSITTILPRRLSVRPIPKPANC